MIRHKPQVLVRVCRVAMPFGEIEDDLVGELSHGLFAALLHVSQSTRYGNSLYCIAT